MNFSKFLNAFLVVFFISEAGFAHWSYDAYDDPTNQKGRYEVKSRFVLDRLTGLKWQRFSSNLMQSYEQAIAYCRNWEVDYRLPTVFELFSLVNATQARDSMPMHQRAFPQNASSNCIGNYIGSDLSREGVSWAISFSANATNMVVPSSAGYVRCVKGYDSLLNNARYLDFNGKAVNASTVQVLDLLTGIIWMRGSIQDATAQNYSTFCSDLALGDQEWHTPSVKELLSLVEYGNEPTIASVFQETSSKAYWTSSPFAISFNNGAVYADSTPAAIKCARFSYQWPLAAYQDSAQQSERFLTQERTAAGPLVIDTFTWLTWQGWQFNPVTANKSNLYCSFLSNMGGRYDDWRVPTPAELATLVDYKVGAMDNDTFPAPENASFWSQKPVGQLVSDGIFQSINTSSNFVRCVRGNEWPIVENRYTDANGDRLTPQNNTALDAKTGILWLRQPINGNEDCGDLQYNFPDVTVEGANIKELLTLLENDSGLFINTTAFPNVAQCSLVRSLTNKGQMNTPSLDFKSGKVVYAQGNCYLCILRKRSIPDFFMWDKGAYEDSVSQTDRFDYIDNDPSVVSIWDHYTDLVWRRYSIYVPIGLSPTYFENYCTSLGSGFRLPTLMELQSILAYTGAKDSVPFNTAVFPSNTTTNYPSLYLSLDLAGGQLFYYVTNFKLAFHNPTIASSNQLITSARCVTASSFEYPPGENRFVNEDGSLLTPASTKVLDALTGLIWMRFGSMPGMNPGQYCNMAQPSGSWIIPTLKQLMTLVNVTTFPFASPDVFPLMSLPTRTYGTSTVSPGQNGNNLTGYVSFVGKEQGITFQESLNYNPFSRLMCVKSLK